MDQVFLFIFLPIAGGSALLWSYSADRDDFKPRPWWLWLAVILCFTGAFFWKSSRIEPFVLQVLDVSGQPVPHAEISFQSELNLLSEKGEVSSDESGRVVVRKLKATPWKLKVTAPGQVDMAIDIDRVRQVPNAQNFPREQIPAPWRVTYSWAHYWYDNETSLSQKCVVTIPAGDSKNMTIVLRAKDSLLPLPYAQWNTDLPLSEKIQAVSGCLEGLSCLDELLQNEEKDSWGSGTMRGNLQELAGGLSWLQKALLKISLETGKGKVKGDRALLLGALEEWATGGITNDSDGERIDRIQSAIDAKRDQFLRYLKPYLLTQADAYNVLNSLEDLCGPVLEWYPDLLATTTGDIHRAAENSLERMRSEPQWIQPLLASQDPAKIRVALTVLGNGRTRYSKEKRQLLLDFIATTQDAALRKAAEQVLNKLRN